jgi:hypothetical protein
LILSITSRIVGVHRFSPYSTVYEWFFHIIFFHYYSTIGVIWADERATRALLKLPTQGDLYLNWANFCPCLTIELASEHAMTASMR